MPPMSSVEAPSLNVNVAVYRPSYQSSVFEGRLSYLANDGNTSTIDLHYCIHTNVETNPWWAVDLLVKLYVAGVKFFNKNSEGI